jgi:hypothetical protein
MRAIQCCLTTWVTIGQNQQKLKQKWLIERLYETEFVENQAKMSHRITRIPCYGTKSAEFEAKMAHRTGLWDNIC